MSNRTDFAIDKEWLMVLKALSLRPDDVLKQASLPADLFQRENARLEAEAYFKLWDVIEQQTSDDTPLPLKIATFISAEMFHPVMFAAFCSSNLKVAVKRISEYKRLIAPMGVSIEETSSGCFFGIEWEHPTIALSASLATTELVYLTQIARIATREPMIPRKVMSPFPLKPDHLYTHFFGIKPTLDQQKHGIEFSIEDVNRPFLTASESMWDVFKPELKRRLSKLDALATTSERVRGILLENLPSGEASIENIASRLALTPRTLQRRLKSEEKSFKEILNQVRQELAEYYVGETKITYAEVAFLIGFEETSSFYRAFKGWTGKTPETYRASFKLETTMH